MPGEEIDFGMDMPDGEGSPSAVDEFAPESLEDDALTAPESNNLDDEFAETDNLDEESDLDDIPEEPTAPKSKREQGINARIRAGVTKGVQREMNAFMQTKFVPAVQQAVEAATAPLRAEIQKYQTSAIEQKAQALVESKQVATIELARLVAQQQLGASVQPAVTPEPNKQPSQQPQQTVNPRVNYLAQQAIELEAQGVHVKAYLDRNPSILDKLIANPRLTMNDVVKHMQRGQNAGKIPPPTRSANGGKAVKVSPKTMTDAQMDLLDAKLEGGSEYFGRG